jgi:hypothetical protein
MNHKWKISKIDDTDYPWEVRRDPARIVAFTRFQTHRDALDYVATLGDLAVAESS